MKLSSKNLKQTIADFIKNNNEEVYCKWDKEYREELSKHIKKLENPNKWKRISKGTWDDKIQRGFQPNTGSDEIDQQLCCFIETNIEDSEIISFSLEA